jgi:hypothetical protein
VNAVTPTRPPADRVCRCDEPVLKTRTRGKWATDRYCERCGRLAPIAFTR